MLYFFEKKVKKAVAESKKVNLVKSIDACSQLSNALLLLNEAIAQKKKELDTSKADFEKSLANKDSEFESLKLSSAQALASLENVINKLSSVLEKDGSGNNNN